MSFFLRFLRSLYNKSIEYLSVLIAGILISITLFLFHRLQLLLLHLSSKILANLFLVLSILLILLSGILFQLLFTLRRLKKNIFELTTLKPAYGVLWDKDFNPYCPSHKILLSQDGIRALKCPNCNKNYYLTNLKGEILTIESVILSLKGEGDPQKAPDSPVFISVRKRRPWDDFF